MEAEKSKNPTRLQRHTRFSYMDDGITSFVSPTIYMIFLTWRVSSPNTGRAAESLGLLIDWLQLMSIVQDNEKFVNRCQTLGWQSLKIYVTRHGSSFQQDEDPQWLRSALGLHIIFRSCFVVAPHVVPLQFPTAANVTKQNTQQHSIFKQLTVTFDGDDQADQVSCTKYIVVCV